MQFHNPKNLAISISLEASELLEHFQWKTMEESEAYVVQAKEEIADEVADVAAYLIELADNLGIDLQEAILNKLAKNEAKYPAHKARGMRRNTPNCKGRHATRITAMLQQRRLRSLPQYHRQAGGNQPDPSVSG
ncbi:nucleotide pyrophosphohydrolase [Pseudomonas aeruginosa]|nr:nucleotide pyrophosphohydrolase [Pseudomonas aeruginosa]